MQYFKQQYWSSKSQHINFRCMSFDFFSCRSEGSVCSRILSTPHMIDTRYMHLFMTFTLSQLHHLKKKLGRQFSFLRIIHGLYLIKSSIQGNLTITSEANKNSVFKFCIVALSRIRLIYYFNSTKNHIFKLSIDSSHMFYFFSHLLDSTWRWC